MFVEDTVNGEENAAPPTLEELIREVESAIVDREVIAEKNRLAKEILAGQARDLREYIEGIRRKAENQIEKADTALRDINERSEAIAQKEHAAQDRVIDAKRRVDAFVGARYRDAAALARKMR